MINRRSSSKPRLLSVKYAVLFRSSRTSTSGRLPFSHRRLPFAQGLLLPLQPFDIADAAGIHTFRSCPEYQFAKPTRAHPQICSHLSKGGVAKPGSRSLPRPVKILQLLYKLVLQTVLHKFIWCKEVHNSIKYF